MADIIRGPLVVNRRDLAPVLNVSVAQPLNLVIGVALFALMPVGAASFPASSQRPDNVRPNANTSQGSPRALLSTGGQFPVGKQQVASIFAGKSVKGWLPQDSSKGIAKTLYADVRLPVGADQIASAPFRQGYGYTPQDASKGIPAPLTTVVVAPFIPAPHLSPWREFRQPQDTSHGTPKPLTLDSVTPSFVAPWPVLDWLKPVQVTMPTTAPLPLTYVEPPPPPPPPPPAPPSTGAGKSKREYKKPVVVEVDGKDYIVRSRGEAEELIAQVQEAAQQRAELAVERAAKATTKPIRKVLHDARKALKVPQISAPKALDTLTKSVLTSVESLYASTMRDIEIAALLKRAQAQEEDDEDVLLLTL